MKIGEERLWEILLDYIEERRVIPVVGPELLTVQSGDLQIPLYRCLADRLADRLKIPLDGLQAGYSLNEVVARYPQAGVAVHKDELYREIRSILREMEARPSPSLLDLASITHFDLFVSLTFDTLLADAINQRRFDGASGVVEVAYTFNDVKDLPVPRRRLTSPLVFQLFGRVSASPSYVICDEDMLEFMSALQDRARQPERLLEELAGNHLLVMGSGLCDWLTRLFIRGARGHPLSMKRNMEVLVGSDVECDSNLVTFLNTFSRQTHLVQTGVHEFVAELAKRWRQRNPDLPAQTPAVAELDDFMKPGSIFISYASEDADAAGRLARALEDCMIDVWFDKGELQAGEQWNAKIRRNIDACSLFVPVISSATDKRGEGYFRKEWDLAVERARGFADDVPFILPVTIDETQLETARIPERFRRSQGTSLIGGHSTPEFADRLQRLVRDFYRRQKAA